MQLAVSDYLFSVNEDGFYEALKLFTVIWCPAAFVELVFVTDREFPFQVEYHDISRISFSYLSVLEFIDF